MNRNILIQETRKILAKTGFYISDENDSRMICFDVVARRDDLLVIIKILTNVDSFTKQNSNDLIVLSNMLTGVPILVGERTCRRKIESGVVYFRHGVPLVNVSTFHDFFFEGSPPLIFSAPGGYYVNIDGDALRNARVSRNISLGTLADIAGVSRKAIQLYESGMSTMIEVALRLEKYLDLPLIQPLNPFDFESKLKQITVRPNPSTGIEQEIYNQLQGLGYNVVPTDHCPFDALTKDNKILIITGVSKQNIKAVKKAKIMFNISKITEHYSVIFLEKMMRKDNLEGTPIIHTEELKKIDDSEDIITLISERS